MPSKKKSSQSSTTTTTSAAPAPFEPVDIHQLFTEYSKKHFNSLLTTKNTTVKWSKRMTRCAGTCKWNVGNITADDPKAKSHDAKSPTLGASSSKSPSKTSTKSKKKPQTELEVTLSEALLQFRTEQDIKDTLLHEMIHAHLFLTKGRFHGNHGDHFQQKMREINATEGSNVSIFHSFHGEVANYQTHWWQCEKCLKVIKRAMNRAPSKNDFWWPQHQAACGGKFIKICEPPAKPEKSKGGKKGTTTKKRKRAEGHQDLLQLFKKVKKANDRDMEELDKVTRSGDKMEKDATVGGGDAAPSDEFTQTLGDHIHEMTAIDVVSCPVCASNVPAININEHLDVCMRQQPPTIVDVDALFPDEDVRSPKSDSNRSSNQVSPPPELSQSSQKLTLESVKASLASLIQLTCSNVKQNAGTPHHELQDRPYFHSAPFIDPESLTPWQIFTYGQNNIAPTVPDHDEVVQFVNSVHSNEELCELFMREYQRLIAQNDRAAQEKQQLEQRKLEELKKADLLEKEKKKAEREAKNFSALESNVVHRDVTALPSSLGSPPLSTSPRNKLDFGKSPPKVLFGTGNVAAKNSPPQTGARPSPTLPPQHRRSLPPQQVQQQDPALNDPEFLDFLKTIAGSGMACYLCGDDLSGCSKQELHEHYQECICSLV